MKRKRMKRLRGIEIEVQNVEIVKERRGEIEENEREREKHTIKHKEGRTSSSLRIKIKRF